MTTKYLQNTAATMSTYVRVTSKIYLLEVRGSGGIGGIEERTSQFLRVLLRLLYIRIGPRSDSSSAFVEFPTEYGGIRAEKGGQRPTLASRSRLWPVWARPETWF
jgi:hypothetical protein